MSKRILVCITLLCLLLSGCSTIGIDVENQLLPPKNNGEQEALQTALEAYIVSQTPKGASSNFTLQYPTEGNYLTPFVMLDEMVLPTLVTPEPQTDESKSTVANDWSDTALAFYSMDTVGAKVHINLLKKQENGTWQSIADIEGDGEEVVQLEFGDINGDHAPELLIGWKMYNTKDKSLKVYSLLQSLNVFPFSDSYTAMTVGDFTLNGADDLLLVKVSSGEKAVTAQLFTYRNGQIMPSGSTALDSDIRRFGTNLTAKLSETVVGVYWDCYKDPDTTVTELIYWQNGELFSPFCDKAFFLTTLTAREIELSCRDIDGDGTVEWPVCERMSAGIVPAKEEPVWKTTWMSYDFVHGTTVEKATGIVNVPGQYMLKYAAEWPEEITAVYDAENQLLTVRETETAALQAPQELLKILANETGRNADLPDEFAYFDKTEKQHYAVWFPTEGNYALTLEEVRYLFSPMM